MYFKALHMALRPLEMLWNGDKAKGDKGAMLIYIPICG